MRILGLSNSTDSGAAVVVDGRIVAAANEERFVRRKLVKCWPTQAMAWVLAEAGVRPEDIDRVAVGTSAGLDDLATLPWLMEDVFDQLDHAGSDTRREVLQRLHVSAERDAVRHDQALSELAAAGVPPERIHFHEHHTWHATGAFACAPFDEAVVLVADGRGDFRSLTLWEARRGAPLRLMAQSSELASPGSLYGSVTKLLGFVPDRHEGNVTGLAAHGRRTEAYDVLRRGFFFEHASGRLRSRIGDFYRPFVGADVPGWIARRDEFRREDWAWAAQTLIEECLSEFLLHHLGPRAAASVNLVLAGGVMSNVKLNMVLRALAPIRDVFVFPHMGDGGGGLSAALAEAMAHGEAHVSALPHVYLGPAFDDDCIRAAAEAAGCRVQVVPKGELPAVAAEAIAARKVVGWFQGRMEYGPRALGARSILAAADDAAITDRLNRRLERSDFMPFAPVTTEALAPECFENVSLATARFMTMCFYCTPYLRRRCPAVVHVDGTARPQVVRREDNPAYHDTVAVYASRTGNPALINTSFNHHEEPIVATPEDAVRSLARGNVDVLLAGGLKIEIESR